MQNPWVGRSARKEVVDAVRKTRVVLQLEHDPEGVSDAIGVASARVCGDLDRIRDSIEQRGRDTGAWRGSINAPRS
jgi:hypothetical protein